VESILITTSAYISTDAIKFAVEKNIDIVFLETYGRKEADPLIQELKQ
jgi:CRISPR-associated protein, Cas1 family